MSERELILGGVVYTPAEHFRTLLEQRDDLQRQLDEAKAEIRTLSSVNAAALTSPAYALADPRLLTIAGLVNAYHNDATTRTAGETLKAVADALGEPFTDDVPASPARTEPALNPPCAQCGGPHPFDTSIPSVVWNRVIRATGRPDYLCLTCIVAAFVQAGESFTANLTTGHVIEVRVDGQEAKDADRLDGENTRLRNALREAGGDVDLFCRPARTEPAVKQP